MLHQLIVYVLWQPAPDAVFAALIRTNKIFRVSSTPLQRYTLLQPQHVQDVSLGRLQDRIAHLCKPGRRSLASTDLCKRSHIHRYQMGRRLVQWHPKSATRAPLCRQCLMARYAEVRLCFTSSRVCMTEHHDAVSLSTSELSTAQIRLSLC